MLGFLAAGTKCPPPLPHDKPAPGGHHNADFFVPSRAPELKPVENVWQYLHQNWLSNTVFENYDAITDAACAAWRNLTAKPETTSIGTRDWPHVEKPIPRTRILCARCFLTLGLRPSQNHKGPRSRVHLRTAGLTTREETQWIVFATRL